MLELLLGGGILSVVWLVLLVFIFISPIGIWKNARKANETLDKIGQELVRIEKVLTKVEAQGRAAESTAKHSAATVAALNECLAELRAQRAGIPGQTCPQCNEPLPLNLNRKPEPKCPRCGAEFEVG